MEGCRYTDATMRFMLNLNLLSGCSSGEDNIARWQVRKVYKAMIFVVGETILSNGVWNETLIRSCRLKDFWRECESSRRLIPWGNFLPLAPINWTFILRLL
jgi:hypothetical protein